MLESESLLSRIRRSCHHYGSRPCVLTDQQVLTHREVWEISTEVASSLAALGLTKGDRIALYAPNGAEFVVLYLAIIRIGAVVVPINLLINTPEICHILGDAGVSCILAYETFIPKINSAIQKLVGPVPHVLGFGSGLTIRQSLADLVGNGAEFKEPSINPVQDLLAILYTSGTTGFPKGAMLTHDNLACNTESVHQAMRWESGRDRVLVVLPMFHAFATTVGLLTPLINGSAIVPLAKFDPDHVAGTIRQHEVTIFLGVPSMFGVLLRLATSRDGDLSSLRFAISGGAALPVSVLEKFEEKFKVRIYEGDGPTECSPVTCVNPIGGVRKPGTVGLPVPGVEMKILDDAGLPCALGEVGEIAVRGRNVMKGYWNRPEETAEVLVDGWFLSGDLGFEDQEGYFSIIDRKKDLILVNGMNVYPRMVEEVLLAHPLILDVAVVGEPDERHGEVPVAFIVLKSSSKVTPRELRDHCRDRLGRHQIPKRMEFIEALPRNASGKVMKRELRRSGEIERGIRSI